MTKKYIVVSHDRAWPEKSADTLREAEQNAEAMSKSGTTEYFVYELKTSYKLDLQHPSIRKVYL